MKSKMIYSDYNPETGESLVIIHNKLGDFHGFAQLHPEDKENESSFVGCRYAEARAHIACEQYKREVLDNQIKALRDFENILKGKWDYNEHSMESKRLRIRIHELKEERATVKNKIAAMKKALKKSMDERDEFVKTKINK